jgi:N-acetylmuramoyl-L-alanine amidase
VTRAARRRMRTFSLAMLALATLGAGSPAEAGTFRVVFRGEGRVETVETLDVGGVTYFSVADLSRATAAVRHWNPENGKLTLCVNGRRISASADNQFVRCDDDVRNLRLPLLRGPGGLWAPPAYLTDALAWALDSDITWDAKAASVSVMTRGVVVTSAAIEDLGSGTALVLGLSGQAEFSADEVDGTIEILVRGAGLSDSLDLPHAAGLIGGVTAERMRSGVLVTARLTDGAGGYGTDLRANPYRLEVVVERAAGGKAVPERAPPSPGGENGHGVERVVDTVIIDPGHGGSDAGAWVPNGLFEKDLDLEFTLELRRALEREGFHVLITREDDETVPLKRRAETANLAEADVFVSIHCGAAQSELVRGIRVLCRAQAQRPSARGRWREGGSRSAAGQSRWDRAQDAVAPVSRDLAAAVRGRVAAALQTDRPEIQSGDFVALSGCSMPAIMVEIGFATNAADGRRLSDETWRAGLAKAIAKGVSDFKADTTRRDL